MIDGFVFLVVLMLNNGQLEVQADVLSECPPQDVVISSYQELVANGDIRDWRALCKKVTFTDQST